MFDWNMDELMWLLMHISADIWTWMRRTEWRYFHGPGSTGKDVLYLLLSYFLGDVSDNGLSAVFTQDYFTSRSPKSELDTVLDTARNMRSVMCNEVPEHLFFNHDRLKPLCEQRGAGMLSRTIYEKPERWLPMCGVQMLSNHEMRVSQKQCKDSGVKRRANVLKLNHVFAENVLKDVKDDIMAGLYNAELFWLSRLFLNYLRRCPVGYTRIHPRPPRVIRETDDLFTGVKLDMLKDFIEDCTHPVKKYKDASQASVLKQHMAKALGLEYNRHRVNPALDEQMEKSGISQTRFGSKKILLYHYPDCPRAMAVALNDDVLADDQRDQPTHDDEEEP
jgi:hypothetical protein